MRMFCHLQKCVYGRLTLGIRGTIGQTQADTALTIVDCFVYERGTAKSGPHYNIIGSGEDESCRVILQPLNVYGDYEDVWRFVVNDDVFRVRKACNDGRRLAFFLFGDSRESLLLQKCNPCGKRRKAGVVVRSGFKSVRHFPGLEQ